MFLPRTVFINHNYQNQLLARKLQYDIFVIHTHYNYKFFTNIVKNPVMISTVRDPEKRIISKAFYSLKSQKKFRNIPAQDFINEIVANSEKYQVNNIMSVFFGIPSSLKESNKTLHRVLHQLNSEFSLVLVLERMDESLVLMKRLLNWSFADIVYRKMKVSDHPKVSLNRTQKEQLRRTNWLDYEVYDFFANELDKKIRNAAEYFQEEVQHFRYVMSKIDEFCLGRNTTAKKYSFDASIWDSGFSIYKHDCNMLSYDLPFLKRGRYTNL